MAEVRTSGSYPPASLAFASLPSAASSAGLIYSVSDVNGVLFRSNGTRWLPVTGHALLYQQTGSLASPLATISSATSGTFSIAAGNPVIPAGVLAAGSTVRIVSMFRRNGANATVNLNYRLGTAATTGDSLFIQRGSIAATDNLQFYVSAIATFSSTTSFTASGALAQNGAGTAATIADRSTNVNTASAMTVTVDVSTGNASDSYNLISLAVELWP